VFVDPGHGGPDDGANGFTTGGKLIHEEDLTLAVGLKLQPLLQQAGYTVVMSRVRDTAVPRLGPGDLHGPLFSVQGKDHDLFGRNACANETHADLLIGVHFNGFADPSVGGAETIYCPHRPFSAQSLRLARLVQHDVLGGLRADGRDIPDRGVVIDTGQGRPLTNRAYGHLVELGPASPPWFTDPTMMPGVIVEPLFVTSPAEADLAVDAGVQEVIARSLERAVEAYFAQT